MNLLHDEHTHPEPYLVLTGLLLLFPAAKAYYLNELYVSGSLAFLSFTTVGFHGTRNEYFFILDLVAITNYIIGGAISVHHKTSREMLVFYVCLIYSIVSYFVGRQYKVYAFDPDWNTQMFWHVLIHVFSTYAAFVYLDTDLNNRTLI